MIQEALCWYYVFLDEVSWSNVEFPFLLVGIRKKFSESYVRSEPLVRIPPRANSLPSKSLAIISGIQTIGSMVLDSPTQNAD